MTLAFARNDRRYCSRCGLPLEDPASEERGTGPICAAKDTVLYARSISANYAGATAVLMGLHAEALPEPARVRYDAMKTKVLEKAQKSHQKNHDIEAIHLPGQDLRPVIREIDWILSHHIEDQVRRFLIRVVKFLGYVELAGVLSMEASTTKAKLWFDPNNGRIHLLGKSCKAGYWAMRKIEDVQVPRTRGSDVPYSAPARHIDAFLSNVQDFWPMYEGDIEVIRKEATDWWMVNAARIALEEAEKATFNPVATLTFKTLPGFDQGTWIEISFPWVIGKSNEMWGIINAIKGQIKARDRKYNPDSRTWLVRVVYQKMIEELLGPYFKLDVRQAT